MKLRIRIDRQAATAAIERALEQQESVPEEKRVEWALEMVQAVLDAVTLEPAEGQ